MSDIAVADRTAAWRGGLGGTAQEAGKRPDARRALQLALAGIWLLDAVLQYQSFMYSKGFAQMLAGTADGNPLVIARPITWNAALVGHHLALVNTLFATIQLLIGLGIAFRPTLRPALAASVAWSLGVWWFGEGLGGVLSGAASPLNGAPGAVIVYALLAALLWPADRGMSAPFTAARAVGAHVARALWLVLWLSLAYFALTPANRAPQAVSGLIAGMEGGQPGWLAAIDRGAASLVAGQGLAASIALAVALAVIAAGVYLPPAAARATLALAIVAALVVWVVGEAFGMILAGGATDPNSGPLLALLALAYWPARTVTAPSTARPAMVRPWPAGRPAADVALAHLLMAIAMAGMLTASLTILPDTAWKVVFGLMTAWFAYQVWRDTRADGLRALAGGHCAPHLVHSAAMLYMLVALTAPAGGPGMAGMGGSSGPGTPTLEHPTLAFAFALVLAGYSVWDLDWLSSRRYGLDSAGMPLAPVAVPAMAAAATTSASSADRAVPGGTSRSGPGVRALLLSSGTAVGCRIVMGVTMAFMLVIMI